MCRPSRNEARRFALGNDAFLNGRLSEDISALEPGSDPDSAAQGALLLGVPQPFHAGRLSGYRPGPDEGMDPPLARPPIWIVE